MPVYLINSLRRSFCTCYKLPWQWNDHIHWHSWESDASAPGLGKHVREGSICVAVTPRGEGVGLWCGCRWGSKPPESNNSCCDPISVSLAKVFSSFPQFPHSWKAYFNFLERRKNWLMNVCKTAKREALCKCHGGLLLFSLSMEHKTMFCIWAQPDLLEWNWELYLKNSGATI